LHNILLLYPVLSCDEKGCGVLSIEKRKSKCRKGESEFLGLVLLIIGAVTICAFLFPLRIWLLLLGAIMIFCGFKLFLP